MNNSPFSTQKQEGSSARRVLWLATVGVLGAAVVGVFGVLAWLVLNRTLFFGAVPGGSAAVPAAPASLSARQAFERAQPVARAWQGDAALTSVSANWDAAHLDDLAGGVPAWIVTFYSPGAGQRQSIVVSSQSVSALAPERPRGLPPTIDLGQWQVDSQQALELFLGNGGREFIIAHEPVDVFLTLSLSEANRLEWIAVALKPPTPEFHGLYINATTGTVQ